jgi:hypothetical protein
MTEHYLQKALYVLFKNRPYNFLNTYFFKNESDFLSFTSGGYLYEYEIKISRSDFKADFKKDRFKMLADCYSGRFTSCIKGKTYEWLCFFDIWHRGKTITNKREQFGHTDISFRKNYEEVANKFYYVVPENLIDVSECPAFAGLIYVSTHPYGHTITNEIKKAPLLHKHQHTKINLFNKMYYSYDSIVRQHLFNKKT